MDKSIENLKPLFNYVIVMRDETQEKSKGGILIADTSKEKPSTGVVIGVGDGIPATETGEIIPTGFEIGDKVLFPRFIGTEIEWGKETLYVMKNTDIMAKIKE